MYDYNLLSKKKLEKKQIEFNIVAMDAQNIRK